MKLRAAFSSFFLAAQPWLAVAWLTGAVLRDRVLFTALLFYIPALFVIATGALWLWLYRRRAARWAYWVVCPLTCVALIKVLAVDFSWKASFGRPTRSVRVIHWNVAHGRVGPEPLLDVLRADDGDVYLLSEFPDDSRFRTFGEELMPGGYQVQRAGMLLVSRFPVGAVESVPLTHGRAWGVRIAPQRMGGMDLVAVDLVANPLRHRRAAIDTLTRWAGRRDRRGPLIALGDFNLPRDSIHFEPLR